MVALTGTARSGPLVSCTLLLSSSRRGAKAKPLALLFDPRSHGNTTTSLGSLATERDVGIMTSLQTIAEVAGARGTTTTHASYSKSGPQRRWVLRLRSEM